MCCRRAWGPPMWLFFYFMNLYIYSDESGVFDYKHNDYFVFGGLICFGKDEKEKIERKYSHVEKVLKASKKYGEGIELKASNISNKHKGSFFRSLNECFKFCVLIREKELKRKFLKIKGTNKDFWIMLIKLF